MSGPELRFSIIGALRTGSSLLTRCLDDHPEIICLCESEINRTLFPGYCQSLHLGRMKSHGLNPEEVFKLLNGKRQCNLHCYEKWHDQLFPILQNRYSSQGARVLGDKSPDFFRTPALVNHLRANHRLIYTARDPRAVFRSISADSTEQRAKDNRWKSFQNNYEVWMPYLEDTSVITVRFEDLIARPRHEMKRIHQHLSVKDSDQFMRETPRKFPKRFLWKTNVDLHTGVPLPLDTKSCDKWKTGLSNAQISIVESNPLVRQYCKTFGYPI